MVRLRERPHCYRWLDAAQLVKHGFGLAQTFGEKPATLVYLFWEPSNARAYSVFDEHRAEVERFAEAIDGDRPGFFWMSYPELWASWEARSGADWLRAHVGRLRVRYGMAA
jgi:hypothetical protein